MPTPRHTLPPQLSGRVFTTAEALEAGIGRHLLGGSSYRSWGSGLWSSRVFGPDARTSAGLLQILPMLQGEDKVASHVTAAVLLGFRLPSALERTGRIHLSTSADFDTSPREISRTRSRAVVGHRASLASQDILHLGAVRVTAPARTLLDLAAMQNGRYGELLSQRQLVAAIDGVVCEHRAGLHAGRPALLPLAALRDDMSRFAGQRGAKRLRQAVNRAAVGVDSPMETYMRLILEDHGLTGWQTDLEIGLPGHRSVCPDLADDRSRLALQFDGAVHEESSQRLRDVERQRATTSAGWTELRVVHSDLESPHPGVEPRLVSLVRAHRAAFAATAAP